MNKVRAHRNRTIILSQAEMQLYSKDLIRISKPAAINIIENKIVNQDTFEALGLVPADFVDLLILDPPSPLPGQRVSWNELRTYPGRSPASSGVPILHGLGINPPHHTIPSGPEGEARPTYHQVVEKERDPLDQERIALREQSSVSHEIIEVRPRRWVVRSSSLMPHF